MRVKNNKTRTKTSIDLHEVQYEGNVWREKEKRDSFGILYIGYPLFIVKIKREIEGEKRER